MLVPRAKMRREERRNIPHRRGDDLVRLPDEIISEILLRLPVKCLLRFKFVCTGWLSLISDPEFAKSHLRRGNPTLKILAAPPFHSLDCQLLDLDKRRAEDEVMNLGLPAMMPKMRPRIWGSCDGLVAFRNDGYMILWNPATRMFRKLPSLRTAIKRRFVVYGIGYDSASDDYKVIVGFIPTSANFQPENVLIDAMELTVKVFSLKANAWRERRHQVSFTINWTNGRGVFAGDAVHWLAQRSHHISSTDINRVSFIVSMKMTDESIGEVVQLPYLDGPHARNEKLQLVILQSRLGLQVASESEFGVWIMNEYGVGSSWTKLYAIPPQLLDTRSYSIDILAISRRGSVIVGLRKAWILLLEPSSLTTKAIPIVPPGSHRFTAVAYTESLVSPPGFRHIGELQ